MGKKLRKVERDTADWKDKFEVSNEQVKKMNVASLEREKELTMVKKKLAAMEKLNRALQKERADLISAGTTNGKSNSNNTKEKKKKGEKEKETEQEKEE